MDLNDFGFVKEIPDNSAIESLKILVEQCTKRKVVLQNEVYRPIYYLFSGMDLMNNS